jgi:hypothetical protein
MNYQVLPDTMKMKRSEIDFWYSAIVSDLKKHTKPKEE